MHCIILSKLLNNSPGPDKESLHVIQDSLPVILGLLSDIINHSLASSTFSDAWKSAEVMPLLKESDHELASNNRPLSLVVASKICEGVVLNQFNSYFTDNNRLSSHQSGNRNIIPPTVFWTQWTRKFSPLWFCQIYLRRLTCSVSHAILLHKLSNVVLSAPHPPPSPNS